MDFRAVLILLSMLFTQAPCRPTESTGSTGSADSGEKLNASISFLLGKIRDMLRELNDPGLLSNDSSSETNVTAILGEEQQPVLAHRLSLVQCHMEEFSKKIPELSDQLMECLQFISDMVSQSSNSTSPPSCSLPAFQQVVSRLGFSGTIYNL